MKNSTTTQRLLGGTFRAWERYNRLGQGIRSFDRGKWLARRAVKWSQAWARRVNVIGERSRAAA